MAVRVRTPACHPRGEEGYSATIASITTRASAVQSALWVTTEVAGLNRKRNTLALARDAAPKKQGNSWIAGAPPHARIVYRDLVS
jgi:hypothetical protein